MPSHIKKQKKISKPELTIVVVKYKEPLSILKRCLESLALQKGVILEILLLDQISTYDCEGLLKKFSNKYTFRYIMIPDISISFARNFGMKKAKTNYVSFVDPDIIAHDAWAYNLLKTLKENKHVAIVGGKISAKWPDKSKWYHKSKLIQEHYSLIDLSENVMETEKIIAGNLALNKEAIRKIGYFKEDLGRQKGLLIGGEETELCQRALKNGYKVMYNPNAKVLHLISKNRLKLRWVIKRIFYGGVTRALKGGMPKSYHEKKNIYDLIVLPLFLIPYTLGFIYGNMRKISMKVHPRNL
ncbi:glycosyltransferase family 2 protein [[Eubacterium] cellulosolvens]